MLCPTCTTVLEHVVQPKEKFEGDHHPNADSFKNAAAGGCHICLPWSKALRRSGVFEDPLQYPFKFTIHVNAIERNLYLMTNAPTAAPKVQLTKYCILPDINVNHSLDLGERTRSKAILDGIRMAQKWMKVCLDHHGDCPKNRIPTSYPARLLEIRHSRIHLVQPEGNFSESFAALSYCWGPNPDFLRLTASNMQQIRDGVIYTDLPIAFQDAVELMRGLGIRYIWIDCLCIIQSGPGSEEDWRTESVKMQDVYSNCIINISLAREADPHHKCFDTTDAMLPFGLTGFREQSWTVVPGSYFEDNLYNQPLGYRAWVLQERILSPRTLSFGLGELFWECSHLLGASESLPDVCLKGGRNWPPMLRLGIREQSFFKPNIIKGLEWTWYTVVYEYTHRMLTKPEKDKLVALSAIAARMMKAMDDIYIMGIFLKTLPRALLWKFTTENERRRLLNGIPSWSWASVDGPVQHGYMSKSSQPLADIVSYPVCALEDKITENTSLTIRAFCNRITNNKSEINVTWRLKGPCEHFAFERYGIWNFKEIEVDWDFPEKKFADGNREQLLALIASQYTSCSGLVLEQSGAQQDRKYRRVGVFKGICSEVQLNEIGIYFLDREFGHSFTSTFFTPFKQEKETVVLI